MGISTYLVYFKHFHFDLLRITHNNNDICGFSPKTLEKFMNNLYGLPRYTRCDGKCEILSDNHHSEDVVRRIYFQRVIQDFSFFTKPQNDVMEFSKILHHFAVQNDDITKIQTNFLEKSTQKSKKYGKDGILRGCL